MKTKSTMTEIGLSVSLQNVSVVLAGNIILNKISAQIPPGESTSIIGPNGAGKTTLLLALLGQIPYTGLVRYTGKTSPRIGYVPQRISHDPGMPLTVLEYLVLNLQRFPLWLGIADKHKKYALELLESVKCDHLLNRRLGTLSGGELQRVLLASALSRNPDLLVLDEPTAGVDLNGSELFRQILEELRHERKFTQIMVTHNLGSVAKNATHVICLNKRVFAEGSPEKVFQSKNFIQLFGMSFFTDFEELEERNMQSCHMMNSE